MSNIHQEPAIDQETRSAIRRLHKDWKELEQEKGNLSTVTALPSSDIFVWHCNLRPDYGPYAGIIFHLILRFPKNYPHSPPAVELCTSLDHPNVFGGWICLDMIKEYSVSTPYVGWTSAYSTLSVLLQLQSFLFAENIPQDYGGTYSVKRSESQKDETIRAARSFWIEIETHDASLVKHTHKKPWPPLPNYIGEPGRKTSPTEIRGMVEPASVATEIQSMVSPELEATLEVTVASTSEAEPSPTVLSMLPSDVATSVFAFLDARDLLRVRDVCSQWRRIVFTYNLFERTQIRCFHSKDTLDDKDTLLGIGLSVEYYPGGNALKSASSPLDLLSQRAFEEEGVRTGVWGGSSESFDHFLPLIFNNGYAAKSIPVIEATVYDIMKHCVLPCDKQRGQCHERFRPQMIFQLLVVLMNSMVVELMMSAESKDNEIQRYASEKALEGYCSFHHMLLYFAKKHPILIRLADEQVNSFISSEKHRSKGSTPNLGVLLVCLTLSRRGLDSLRRPLVMETFDRQVRWLLQKDKSLSKPSLPMNNRLEQTFIGAKTSLRLLMFQVYFLSRIGRPAFSKGPFDVLDSYEKRMGKPTTSQKEDLQQNAKGILKVSCWEQFFRRLGGQVPPRSRLHEILRQAVSNSERKGYHWSERKGGSGGKSRKRKPRGNY